MIKVLYQPGMFREAGHFLLISIDAPDWAHDLLRRLSPRRQSTLQISEGPITWVGYEYSWDGARQAKESLDNLVSEHTLTGAMKDV